jgi:hypothetical protein
MDEFEQIQRSLGQTAATEDRINAAIRLLAEQRRGKDRTLIVKCIIYLYTASIVLRGPRIIAANGQVPRIYPRMILLCSRFDSVLFTPKRSAIATYGYFSRSP